MSVKTENVTESSEAAGPIRPAFEPSPSVEHEKQAAAVAPEIEAYAAAKGERVANKVRELLDGIEVAPEATTRPGAKALVSAAAEWALGDPTKHAAAKEIAAAIVSVTPEQAIAQDEAIEARARLHAHAELTRQAKEWLSGQGANDPALAEARRKLGITVESEEPFDVVVVDATSGMYEDLADQGTWSELLLPGEGQTVPPVFMFKADERGNPARIILDRDTARFLLDAQNVRHDSAVRSVTHEFAHTQRTFKTAANVGDNLEERMAILATGGQTSYPETFVYEKIIDSVTDGQYRPLFEEVMAGRASVDQLYDFVSEKLGPQAALALAAIPPQVAHYELPGYAMALVDSANESGPNAVYRHLTERVDREALAQKVGNVSDSVAMWILRRTVDRGIVLDPSLRAALLSKLDAEQRSAISVEV